VAIFIDLTENEGINERHLLVKSDNLTTTEQQIENGARYIGCKLSLYYSLVGIRISAYPLIFSLKLTHAAARFVCDS